MKEYKLKQGVSKTYPITNKEDFEEQTGKSDAYKYTDKKGIIRGLAVCPACDNPVSILGIFQKLEKQVPHARHTNKSTIFATFDPDAYYHCPNADPGKVKPLPTPKDRKPSTYEIKIYNTLREYFDKAIYILNKDLNIYISNAFARRLLMDFLQQYGYMQPNASLYNLPWMLLETSFSFSLINRMIKRNSSLWLALNEKKADISFKPYEYKDENGDIKTSEYDLIEPKENKFLTLEAHFIHHNRKIINDDVKETITLGISDSADVPIHWIYKEEYNINTHRFLNLCVKGKDKYRNQGLLNIAEELMPNI